MKQSADYGLWAEGRMIAGPLPLPDAWNGDIGLRQWTDERLAEAGWYPIERQCPKCAKNLQYRLDSKRGVIFGFIPQELIDRTKEALKGQVERMLQQPAIIGFISDALDGGPHYYSAAPESILPAFAASIARQAVPLWCKSDIDDRLHLVMHTPRHVDAVIDDYLTHYREIVIPHMVDAMAQVKSASTHEEVQDANDTIQQFFQVWQRRAGF